MQPWLKLCWQGTRFCGACVLGFAVWTLWLALCLLLAFQLWIATAHELAVPAFALRGFEERLAASGVHVKFGRAQFDPAGRILLENLSLSLPAFSEPVVTNRVAYLEVDPWALLAGKFDRRRLHVSGASLAVPAMLSPSGRTEEFLRNLDASFLLRENEFVIEHLTAQVAGIAISAHGALHLAPQPATGVEPLPIAGYLASHYPDICRQLVRIANRLAALDAPQLAVELSPSNTRGALASVTVVAQGLKLAAPLALQAAGLRLTTRFPLQGEAPVMAPLNITVDRLEVGGGVSLRGLQARLRGSLKPALYTYEPREALLSATRLSARGFDFTALLARLTPGPLSRLQGELAAECAGAPFAVNGQADLLLQTAAFRFDGALAPALLAPISAALHHDLRPFIGFGSPVRLGVDVTFDPGWKFTRLAGQLAVENVDAYHVPIDAAGGEIEFDGHHFTARHAFARLGDNIARGSFEQDFATMDYRFLLEGRLRPLEISGWFGKWWSNFFRDFEFPVAPPAASVDVAGRWREGRLATVFVFADSAGPVIHSVKIDHARTLLFIRPNFYDGLEFFATIGAGSARGTFARQIDPGDFSLVRMDLAVDSSLPLDAAGRIFGPTVADELSPFRFAKPPELKLDARFDGPASSAGVHQQLHIAAQSVGGFAFHDFPLGNLSFNAVVHDDEVTLDNVTVGFAGGLATGHARVWGHEASRRLGFDYALKNASLGQAISALEAFSAGRKGLPAPAPGKFVQDKASVKLDLAVSAEGRYDDPLSYKGAGSAVLEGPRLGEVRMLGLLSELLSFTSLRFTTARTNFKVEGARLVFPEVRVTGANSAIEGRGSYALDRHELDFTARVSPFQESTFFPSALIGVVLSPLSSILEVKLTGQLDNPRWDFVNGPTNFLRNLTRPAAAPEPAAPKPDYLRR